jgi:PhzF family phenazine biosynthesis protein
MRIRSVNAFTEDTFAGNPAAVAMLDHMPTDEWMAKVARQMNLSETAFVIRAALPDADYQLRWFTPTVEVDMCGHATLASAHCLFEDGISGPIRFSTRSGVLVVRRNDNGMIAMDFPSIPPVEVEERAAVSDALGVSVLWTGGAELEGFLLALLENERAVRDLVPNITAIEALKRPLIITAQADAGRDYDFVSRVFAPTLGINEDPVTGSSHTLLAPFWGHRLTRTAMRGLQASARSGVVGVELNADLVVISGYAITVFDGDLKTSPV